MVASGGWVAVGERTPCRLTITADRSSSSAAIAASPTNTATSNAARNNALVTLAISFSFSWHLSTQRNLGCYPPRSRRFLGAPIFSEQALQVAFGLSIFHLEVAALGVAEAHSFDEGVGDRRGRSGPASSQKVIRGAPG